MLINMLEVCYEVVTFLKHELFCHTGSLSWANNSNFLIQVPYSRVAESRVVNTLEYFRTDHLWVFPLALYQFSKSKTKTFSQKIISFEGRIVTDDITTAAN
jgi:hypothetical protein